MNKYAVYDSAGKYLFDVHAEDSSDALAQARKSDRNAFKIKLVFREKGDRVYKTDGSGGRAINFRRSGVPNWNSEE